MGSRILIWHSMRRFQQSTLYPHLMRSNGLLRTTSYVPVLYNKPTTCIASADYHTTKCWLQSDNKQNQVDEPAPNTDQTRLQTAQEEPKKVGIFERFKIAYKMYGKVLVGVHVATSAVWFSCFYLTAVSVDVVALLQSMGVSATLIKPLTLPGVGNVAVMYLLYKMVTPLRYAVTLGGTQLAVRQLTRMGYMKPPAEKDRLRNLMKDKYGDMKDDMKEGIRDKQQEMKQRVLDSREQFKDKLSDMKGDVKDKMKAKVTDIKGGVKGKINQRIDDAKDKYSGKR